MNILVCLIWMNIMTQAPVISKNIIIKEYPKAKRKRVVTTLNSTTTTEIQTTTSATKTTVIIPYPKDISKVLIEGPVDEIPNAPLEYLVEAIRLLKNIKIIPANHIMEVWKMVKGNKSRESITVEDLEKLSGFLDQIPDSDLYYFNMSDWNLVEYLGKVKEFPKRVVSILSASLLKEHGNEILNNHSMINRMYGIICGFDKPLIKNIPDKEFLQIDQEIFENLHGCSKSDKRVFFEKATKSTIFGPPQVWDAETVAKANMLILAMEPREIGLLRPPALKGLKESILKKMRMELILVFNNKQISYFSTKAYLLYKERILLSSKQIYHKSNLGCIMLIFFSFLIYSKDR